ncbi:transglycosylase domain-containing protein [Streptomyces sp. KR80]|uniref:transglycosylase domain-containing protein n=1 Tax=Streptomyces sp. KR80 TaxID=3457426 RepID=UPI003FD23785
MSKKRPGGGGPTSTQQVAKFLGVSVLAGAVLAGLALPAVGALGLAAKGSVEGFDEIPATLKRPPLSQKTTILDIEGQPIASVYSRDRTVVPLKDISPLMRKAMVAIEDARFYEHGAIDLKGVLRALNRNAQAGGVSQGASTLTQQYVKNVFVEEAGDDRAKYHEATQQTLGRKIKELKYAIQVEEELGKKKILENYLNITFFGQQAYGVEAAARRYFSTSAKDLKLEQAALLAGLVQSPYRYDPLSNEQEATKRRNTALQRMADLGDISQAQADRAKEKPLGLDYSKPRNGCITATSGAGFFCDYVRQVFLQDKIFGKTKKERAQRWNRGGLTIRTTLDPQAQAAASKAATSKVDETDKIAASVVQVQPGTGRIISMAQSRPYGLDGSKHQSVISLNVDNRMGGTYAGFQVGSTFKPFTAAAALEKGISPAKVFSSGWKMSIPESSFRTCEGGPAGGGIWNLQNEKEDETGSWDMTSALGKSINTYFAQLEKETGLCETLTMAKKMGVRKGNGQPLSAVPSLTLGSQDISPLTMAAGYATFANRGTYCTPVAIDSVTDVSGRKLDIPKSRCSQAMSERTADTINQMLKGVVEDGTGTRAGLSDRDNAGKTGTTNDRKDAWFVGYTPDVSTAVWVGADGAKKIPMYRITIGGVYYDKVCGGCLPGPIWKTAMRGALEGIPATPFNPVHVPRGKDKRDKDEEEDGESRPGDGRGHDDKPFPDFSIPPDIIGGWDGKNGGGWGRRKP